MKLFIQTLVSGLLLVALLALPLGWLNGAYYSSTDTKEEPVESHEEMNGDHGDKMDRWNDHKEDLNDSLHQKYNDGRDELEHRTNMHDQDMDKKDMNDRDDWNVKDQDMDKKDMNDHEEDHDWDHDDMDDWDMDHEDMNDQKDEESNKEDRSDRWTLF